MTNKNEPIIIEQVFNSTINRVWTAITDDSQMKQWFFESIISFKPELHFTTTFDVQFQDKNYLHIWKILEVDTEKKIVYSWQYAGYPGYSTVNWELSSQNNLTKLKLTHQGQETFPKENPDFNKENCTEGWKFFICQRLKAFLEAENL